MTPVRMRSLLRRHRHAWRLLLLPKQAGLNELKSTVSAQLQAPELSTSAWATQAIQRQDATLDEIEKALMQAALDSAKGNISKAATLLGISRAQLDYRVKKISNAQRK